LPAEGDAMIWARQRLSTAGGRPLFVCLVVLATAQLLAGCGCVVSSTPWFGPDDAVGAPRLRAGVWRVDGPPDKPCHVDERRPLATWPECALGLVVRPFDLLLLKPKRGGWDWESWPYVIADGAPAVMQVNDYSDSSGGSYDYLGVRPVRLDSQGLAVVIEGWGVRCKPPPPTAPSGSDVSEPLYPGLTAVHEGCTADSAAALRSAARSAEMDYGADVFQAHWVRDGSR
jgi:hypothetical protein